MRGPRPSLTIPKDENNEAWYLRVDGQGSTTGARLYISDTPPPRIKSAQLVNWAFLFWFAFAAYIGVERVIAGRSLWPMAPWAVALVFSLLWFIYRRIRVRRAPPSIIELETEGASMRLCRSGVSLPVEHVRAVQLLKGVINPTDSATDMFQIVVVTHASAEGWQRHLAFASWGKPPSDAQRAVVLFGRSIGVEGSCWRIGGWRAPKNTYIDPKRGKVTRAGLFEPCVEPLDRAARDRAGLLDYDAYAEPLVPPVAKNLCLACGYSLQGLTTDTCPECGTNFIAKPDARG